MSRELSYVVSGGSYSDARHVPGRSEALLAAFELSSERGLPASVFLQGAVVAHVIAVPQAEAALDYHAMEAAIVADVNDPRRLVPTYDCAGWDVLDIGCGAGQTLMAPELAAARTLCGVDVDAKAIARGLSHHPRLTLSVGSAEAPGVSGAFDLVYSRVALPYTDIPRALASMAALTKSGGHVWITWHTWRNEFLNLGVAIRQLAVKRIIDRLYVITNSLLFALTGRVFPRPWNGRTESVQTEGAVRRAMTRAGFTEIQIKRDRWHFLATARRLSAHADPSLTDSLQQQGNVHVDR